jgi:hypothetical protein
MACLIVMKGRSLLPKMTMAKAAWIVVLFDSGKLTLNLDKTKVMTFVMDAAPRYPLSRSGSFTRSFIQTERTG